MEKAAELQKLIKQNNNDYMDFLQDLNRWEDSVKKEDQNLQTCKRLEEKLPPVRKKVKVKDHIAKTEEKKTATNEETETEKQSRISSYDYNAWSKFDVDAACADLVTSSDSNSEDDDAIEENNNEEQLKIEEERKIQQASMEKEKGNQLFKEGKYEAAINRYTNAITLHPSNPIFYANRGMALLKTEKYAAAEQDCSIALKYDPNYTKAYARRATARKKLKNFQDALHDYERVLTIEPKNKQALEEIEDIEKIIKKAKENSNVKKNNEVNSTSNLSKVSRDVPRKRRSNKPMKRIFIEEIGDEKTEKTIVTSNNIDPANLLANGVPKLSEIKLSVPNTSFMLDSDFKRLNKDEELLYDYVKAIPTTSYAKLFSSIDILISPMIKILNNFYKRDKRSVHEELNALSDVKRFDMACMFLSRDDKKGLVELFEYIESSTYESRVDKSEVTRLKKKYGIT